MQACQLTFVEHMLCKELRLVNSDEFAEMNEDFGSTESRRVAMVSSPVKMHQLFTFHFEGDFIVERNIMHVPSGHPG